MINIVSIIFTIISILLILFLWKKPLDKKIEKKVDKVYKGIILFLTGLFVFLLTFNLGNIPNGLHVDEAGMAYDALNLSRYGVDRFLYQNPVYFINFGGGQNALYTYLASIVIDILGFSVENIRLPAILLSFISAYCFVSMMKKEKGKLSGVITLFLLVCLPFSIMHSRWGLESYLLFPMIIISCYFLYQALTKHKKRWFIFSGISFGLTLYTYAVSYLILPIFLAIVLLYGLYSKKIKWSECFLLGIPLFILALPLILMLAVNNGLINEIKTPFLSIPELFFYRGSEFSLQNIWKNFNIFGILFSNDGLIYNAFKEYGTVYYFSIPFCIYGFILVCKNTIQAIKEKKINLDGIMLALFISVFLITMTLDGPNINRANAIYFPLIYFIIMGISALISKKNWSGYVILTMYLIMFLSFGHYYFKEYPKEVHDTYFFVSEEDIASALSFASQSDADKIYVIDESYHQPYIYTMLALEMDPYTFNEKKIMDGNNIIQVDKYYFRLDEIKKGNIYIFLKENQIPEEIKNADFKTLSFGSINVYY